MQTLHARVRGGLRGARAALADAEALDDDALRVSALSTAAFLGRAVAPRGLRVCRGAREIASRIGDTELLKGSAAVLGQVLLDCGEYEAARDGAWSATTSTGASGTRVSRPTCSGASPGWSSGAATSSAPPSDAARSQEIAVQYGLDEHPEPLPAAWTAAYRGQLELARELAERGLALCQEQIHVAGPLFPGVLGLVASWSGDVASGVAQFAEADRLAFAIDWRNPHNAAVDAPVRRGTARARPHR